MHSENAYFYHLSGRSTPRYRTSSSRSPVYMIFQPVERTAYNVTITAGSFLPCLLTLTLMDIPYGFTAGTMKDYLHRVHFGGCFLLRCHAFANIFRFGSTALFVVRTFLPYPSKLRRRLTLPKPNEKER